MRFDVIDFAIESAEQYIHKNIASFQLFSTTHSLWPFCVFPSSGGKKAENGNRIKNNERRIDGFVVVVVAIVAQFGVLYLNCIHVKSKQRQFVYTSRVNKR